MRRIILVRHGETQWNVVETFRGRADIELTPAGVRQAEQLAEHLSRSDIAAIYSSPLRRALATAGMVARHHDVSVMPSRGLNDIDYGEWQGVPLQTVKERYPELYDRWLKTPHQMRLPGGETLSEVRRRSLAAVKDAISRYDGTVVMVAHRAVLQVLICALLGLPTSHYWNISIDLCGTTTFAADAGRLVLLEHNNTSYIQSV